MATFQENLITGREWEIKVSNWLQKRQKYVFDVYEYSPNENGITKSPRLKIIPTEESLILPDLQIASKGMTRWIEVKSKSSIGFPFQENRNYRTTGIDLTYWQHYLKVRRVTGLPVYIFFVHYNEGEIRFASLDELESHDQKYENPKARYGNGGMVFWNYDSLELIARIDDSGNIIDL